ncbi:MAG: sodium/proton-translocating pyrophosphatase, partial [Burkholderiaceae bacterium]
EYYTSYESKPTQGVAARSVTGPATVIISGFASGMLSTIIPMVIIAAAVLGAHQLAGLYGIAIAAVGMLSTLG